jgi:hypothetical protein
MDQAHRIIADMASDPVLGQLVTESDRAIVAHAAQDGRLQQLVASLKRVKPRARNILAKQDDERRVGDVWYAAPAPDIDDVMLPDLHVVIMRELDDGVVLVTPLIHWPEYGAASDVGLPDKWFGHCTVFAPSMAFSMLTAELISCNERLPDALTEQLWSHVRAAMTGTDPDWTGLNHTPDYLDEQDVRYVFKSHMLRYQIEPLQASLLATLD